MKFTVLFISLALLSGCDFFKSKKAVQMPTDATVAPTPAVTKECRPVTSAPDLAIWKMVNGVELVVCDIGASARQSENEFSGWVNVYKKIDQKLSPYLAEVKSEKPSDFSVFSIKKVDESTVMITRKILSPNKDATGEDDVPVTEIKIDCKTNDCVLEKEKCLPTPRKKKEAEAVQTVKDVVAGKIKAADVGMYDVTIGKVISAATTGNAEALKLILDHSEEELKADGAAGESLSDGKRLLQQMVALGCLRREEGK